MELIAATCWLDSLPMCLSSKHFNIFQIYKLITQPVEPFQATQPPLFSRGVANTLGDSRIPDDQQQAARPMRVPFTVCRGGRSGSAKANRPKGFCRKKRGSTGELVCGCLKRMRLMPRPSTILQAVGSAIGRNEQALSPRRSSSPSPDLVPNQTVQPLWGR